jgi:predicted transport protein
MDIDKATQTMIDNLYKNTGKTLEQWMAIVNKENFAKHGEIVKFLKEKHQLTHGFANLVAHKAKATDAGSAENPDDLVAGQYKGKENLKPIYDKLMAQIENFGQDIEIAPKNAYVSLRRKKQFATLGPATKTRFEVGINLKGEPATGRLEAEKPNAMCSHKIKITDIEEVDKEVISWLKKSYENAG